MRNLSFKRHRFPPEVIRSSIWLYARFTLSLRDVEEMFAERGLDVSYETVRRWFLKFGPAIAANLKRARPKPSDHWHLDEMAVVIRGKRCWLWRAVDNVRAADAVRADVDALDLVFVASGMLHDGETLHPEKTWRTLDGAALERVYRINAVGPALVAKHSLPLLARDRKSVFATLSARVGSISDNRLGGWHAYRASKAALNMLVRTFAIELARRNPRAICVGLHPGTVDTGLSAPFQAKRS